MSEFCYVQDFEIPFSKLEEKDQSWLMSKVWALIDIRDLRPAVAPPPRYMPEEGNNVYEIWRKLRGSATKEELNEATKWWIDYGFAITVKQWEKNSEQPQPTEEPSSDQNTGPDTDWPEPPPTRSGDSAVSEDSFNNEIEIVEHLLSRSAIFSDQHKLLLLFRKFELTTKYREFQALHFRGENERAELGLSNIDATLAALEKKELVKLIAQSPKKTYALTANGCDELTKILKILQKDPDHTKDGLYS